MTKPNVQIMIYSKQSAYQPIIVLLDIDHTEQHSHFLFHSLQQLQNYCESRSQWAPSSEIVQIWKEAKHDYSVLIAPACSPTSLSDGTRTKSPLFLLVTLKWSWFWQRLTVTSLAAVARLLSPGHRLLFNRVCQAGCYRGVLSFIRLLFL